MNLDSENGKGEIELDWSEYDIEDKYFVIYRKQENSSKWEKIVDLNDKFNDNKYKDILANDKNNPNISQININPNKEKNNIEVNLLAEDIGTQYNYYIESYDSNTNLLIGISNEN